jgi:glycosidase
MEHSRLRFIRGSAIALALVSVLWGLAPTTVRAATTSTVVIHYKPSAGDSTAWNLWVWEPSFGTGGQLKSFTGSDRYGKVATLTFDHSVTSLGFIVMTDTTTWRKDVAADRFISVVANTAAIWLQGGDAKIYAGVDNNNSPILPLDGSSSAPALEPSTARVPTWTKNAVIYEVNVRDYTNAGTFMAFADHLPRLKALGVDILWIMPIHPIGLAKRLGGLGSPYSLSNYQAVNPEFGSAQSFKQLVATAHKLGMKVVLDWVGNHTSFDNVWIGPHKDWYTQDGQGNIITPPGTGWTDLAELNYGNTDMRAAMISAMRMWVKTYGVDGFRADYAPGVPTDFWESANSQLQTIKPLFMLAESDGKADLLQNAFLSNYGWSLNWFMNNVKAGQMTKSDFKSQVDRLATQYPAGTYPMTFITNHDQNAWDGTEFERMGAAVPAMATLEFLFPGIPMLYSGQEVGLNRRLSFFDKDQITWPTSSNWTPFYQKLIDVKTRNSALWNGTYGGPLTTLGNNNDHVISFVRTKGTNRVIGVINLSNTAQSVTVAMQPGPKNISLFRLETNTKTTITPTMTFTLPAFGYEVFSTVASKVN